MTDEEMKKKIKDVEGIAYQAGRFDALEKVTKLIEGQDVSKMPFKDQPSNDLFSNIKDFLIKLRLTQTK